MSNKHLTKDELDTWLVDCLVDPSIVHPQEMGYIPTDDGGAVHRSVVEKEET